MALSLQQVMKLLRDKGNPQRVQVFANHGAPTDAMFGVSVADMKVIAKKIKGEQQLAYELYDTGNADAMYLAGMVADGSLMTKTQLNRWAKNASWLMVAEYTVPRVAVENKFARDLALKWMRSRQEMVAACGWSTYAGLVAVLADDELDMDEIRKLLKEVEQEVDDAANRVRYTMNGFVISVGTYVKPCLKNALATAKRLGKVDVDLGGTGCKVPQANDVIGKVVKMGRQGRKRKTLKC